MGSAAVATLGKRRFFLWRDVMSVRNLLESKIVRRLAQDVKRFLQDESGPTAVEYAVMLALIVVVCVGAITVLGQNASGTFAGVSTTLKAAGS
jgi:pilus assembly protein Flp/PilA